MTAIARPATTAARTADGSVDVLVLGGGQAALAAGYYLARARRRGTTDLSFALLDANEHPGGAWTGVWDSMQLFSPASFSSLPGWPMPPWIAEGNPSSAQVRAYLAAYEDRSALPVHRPVRARTVTRTADGFEVVTDGGVWRCRVLVNATGAWGRPFWPSYPGMATFAGRQLHTVDYRRAADFEGQAVLVVGGGNSGAQIAADLARREQGQTVWVTARPPRFLPDDVDGRTLFELATRRLRAATDRETSEQGVGGLGDIVMVPPVLAARRRGDLEAPAAVRPPHHSRSGLGPATSRAPGRRIIWCTGFRPDMRHLGRLPLTRQDGLPTTDPALPTRSVDEPALFFLGYGDWCGPASATLIGVGAVARATADDVVHQLAVQATEVSERR